MSLSIAITPAINELLDQNCVVAVGVSGGKDSQAAAVAIDKHLRHIGHQGQRILIHSDLGRVEWRQSLPSCETLASAIGWELMTVRRSAGDLLDRWEDRWTRSIYRYESLSCVKLIMPWSSPSLRFCTSEAKTDVICSALKKRFPGQNIISVTGVRREESARRSKMPVSSPLPKLSRSATAGISWNPIIEWPVQAVFDTIENAGLKLHEAYSAYGCSRVSCAFCIMSSNNDMLAAASCETNHDLYRSMVDLENRSAFAFQGQKWLADIAPRLLTEKAVAASATAKRISAERNLIEAEWPKHLLYTKGWPTSMPTPAEAAQIATIRRNVSNLMSFNPNFIEADQVLARYQELKEKA